MGKFHNSLSSEERESIRKEYLSGISQNMLVYKTGRSAETINKICKGLRSRSDSMKIAVKEGRRHLTENGRSALSKNGRLSCQKTGKFYTKPERKFKEICNEIGIGVEFPEYVCEIKGVVSDNKDKFRKMICFQYPIQRYVLDFVDIENKIAININGDYWHANPLLYEERMLGEMQRINVRQDSNKRIFLEKNGWKVLDIWESEIYWNKNLVIERLRAVGVTGTREVYTLESGVQLPHCPPDWSDKLKSLWFKKNRPKRKARTKKEFTCQCGKTFYDKREDRKFCSQECCQKYNDSDKRPLKEILELELKTSSYVELGKKYGVSDTTVKKWARRYSIPLTERKSKNGL